MSYQSRTKTSNGEAKKHPNWEFRLNHYIDQVRQRKFKWGTFDCCIFTVGILRALTNQSYFAEDISSYHDLESAMKFIHDFTGKYCFYVAFDELITHKLTSIGAI